ncbi:hypothetical protein LJB42_002912 [Komagataella kurtzmanii]|nr:hypothetical protein LJB42_002912 [Komagataella kurtzmanii]
MFAFLDVTIGGSKIGRIVLQLDNVNCPLTSTNFLNLCNQVGKTFHSKEYGDIKLTYQGIRFHRIMKNFIIQAGDLVFGRDDSFNQEQVGGGGVSTYINGLSNNEKGPIYGKFDDEALDNNPVSRFDRPFVLAMANSGPNSNSSQFFITTSPCPHLQGKHTAFGSVVHGKSVVRDIEKVDTTKENNSPLQPVVIVACGEWKEGDPVPVFNCSNSQIGGDVFEEYPDDDDNFDKDSLEKALEAVEIIKESGSLLFKQNQIQNALFKYKKSYRYLNEFSPDQDQSPQLYNRSLELKKKLYLNLSLVYYRLGQFSRARDYAEYLLEMEDNQVITDKDRAKAFFRKGLAQIALNDFEHGLHALKAAQDLTPSDSMISNEILKASKSSELFKKREKSKVEAFFK